jgi:hypothetical protein
MELYSSSVDAPELPLGGFMPNDDPVQIKNIDGLGPVKADIVTTPFATGRGELYQGATTGKRNIVMTLGYNPDWVGEQTMSSLRQLLYRYMLPEAWIKLRFFTDELPPVDIEGYVESFDPNIFSQDPEVQVSIINPEPDFVDANATLVQGVVDTDVIENEFDYTGTTETGFELVVKTTDDNPDYTGSLIIIDNNQTFEVNPVTSNTAKYFKLNSVRGHKRVGTVDFDDGGLINLLPQVTLESVWPVLTPGKNLFSVVASEVGQAWTLAYFNRFAGL